jgi:choice-of-anchor C domain-containing protein
MNHKQWLRRGVGLGLGLFALAGCGGPDANVINDPELGNVAQGVNVASNGSFEFNSAGPVNYVVLSPGSTALPGWSISGGGVKVMTNSYKTPYAGTQSIDLNGYGAGVIEQYVPTVVGGGYTLSFAISNSPNCVGASRSVQVAYDTRTASTSNTSGGWSTRSYVFNATTTSTLIRFTSTSGGVTCGIALDNVAVNGP